MGKKVWARKGQWLAPRDVAKIVALSHGKAAEIIVMEHIRGGILDAIASRTSDAASDAAEPEISNEPEVIPVSYWSALQDESTFWSVGAARFSFYDAIYGTRTIRCYGIRFSRRAVEKIFPTPDPTTVALAGAFVGASVEQKTPVVLLKHEPTPELEPEEKGPPVSPEALAGWAALYVKTYSEKEDTLDKAWASARGMFQGKSVTRQKAVDAVAKLRPRGRGRKPDVGE